MIGEGGSTRRGAPGRALLLLALLAGLLAPAAGASGQRSAPGTADVEIRRDEATVDFPTGIDFALEVVSADPIEQIDLLYRPVTAETLILERPRFAPGREVALTHEVELEAGGLPPGVDLRYRWRVVEADGDVAESPERTLRWEDTRFDWAPLAGARATVFAYNNDPAFNRAVLDSAEATIDRLGTEFGARPAWPIRIWVYASGQDLGGALAPNSEPWIAGAAHPWYGLILAVLPTGDLAEVERVVPHEVSHLVLFAATRSPFGGAPGWFDEGLAVLAQGSGAEAYPSLVRRALSEERLPSIRSLNGEFPYDPDGAQLAYAQSLSVVTFVLERWGEAGISDSIAAFRDGLSVEEATRRALGVGLDELDRLWREWLAAQPDPGPAGTLGGPDGPAGVLLAAAGSLLMGAVALLAVVAGIVAFRRARAGGDPGLPAPAVEVRVPGHEP